MKILEVIGSVLAIIIGLWKFFAGKKREQIQRAEKAKEKVDNGIQSGDVSSINGGFNDINSGL